MERWRGRAVSSNFGFSHIHDGFDPRAFDTAFEGTALATRSINGAVGGQQSEQRMMALEFVRGWRWPPVNTDGLAPQSCFVLLEINAGANFTNDIWRTLERSTFIIGGPTIYCKLTDSHKLAEAVRPGGYAAVAAGLHYMNVGMVSSTIFSAPVDRNEFMNDTQMIGED